MVRLTVLAMIMSAAVPALAQTTPPATPTTPGIVSKAVDPYAPTDPDELEAWLRARGEAYYRAPDARQDPAELAQTASLNAEIAANNDRAEAQEQSNVADYEAAKVKYDAAVSAHRAAAAEAATAQANYEADLRASQAAQAQYERDQAEWRRRVAACERGDRSACAPRQ
ncbi:MAG: cell wall hydrolase [Caulobacterales bacterium]|nr:cell wall hydrolase [Caulobacterales bacterium]